MNQSQMFSGQSRMASHNNTQTSGYDTLVFQKIMGSLRTNNQGYNQPSGPGQTVSTHDMGYHSNTVSPYSGANSMGSTSLTQMRNTSQNSFGQPKGSQMTHQPTYGYATGMMATAEPKQSPMQPQMKQRQWPSYN